MLQLEGGGGGGGRIAILVTEFYDFRGQHTAYGGKGGREFGGSGTIYVEAPNKTAHLFIDNQGYKPTSDHIINPDQDSCRTYIVNDPEMQINSLHFDDVTIRGGGHLSVRDTTVHNVPIDIGTLHGDMTGFLHVLKGPLVNVWKSSSPFPAAFRVYTDAVMSLPNGTFFFITFTHKYVFTPN